VSSQFAAQAAVNANVTDALAAALAAQAEQAAAQAAAMSNVTETLAAVLGGLSALQTSVGALAARMDAVEANTGLLDSLVVSPPPLPPPPLPPPSPPPPPFRSAAQCFLPYTWVNDTIRGIEQPGDQVGSCDGGMWNDPTVWYRFGADSHNYMAWWNPSSVGWTAPGYPPGYGCSTVAPGYLTGRYPTLGEGIITGQQICYSFAGPCWRSSHVSIVQCDVGNNLFFLFRFEEGIPQCDSRICTTTSVPQVLGTV
jgi:hypothetical protein